MTTMRTLPCPLLLLVAACTPGPTSPDVPDASGPTSCAPAGTAYTLWVANQAVGVDAVHVLRPSADPAQPAGAEMIATIPAGRAPHNLTFTPDLRFAYVANLSTAGEAGTVSVIDAASLTVVASVTVGQTPHSVRVSPDGREAWVANIGSDDVSVIDTATNEAAPATIPVGQGPTQIAFTLDGAKAYVANGDDGTVSVIGAAARTPTKLIPTGGGSMGLGLRADGTLLFETEPSDDRVSVIDTGSDAVVNVIDDGGALLEPHGLAFAGDVVVITNATNDSVIFVDARTLAILGAVAVAGRPQLVAISPDCSRAYLTLRDSPSVAVVDVATLALVGTIDLGTGSVHGIAVRRDP